MTDEEQRIEWERQEEHDEWLEAQHTINNNLWLCDDGAP